MEAVIQQDVLGIELSEDKATLFCQGQLVIKNLNDLRKALLNLEVLKCPISQIDISNVSSLDTTGAMILLDLKDKLIEQNQECQLVGVTDRFETLMGIIVKEQKRARKTVQSQDDVHNDLYWIGKAVIRRLAHWQEILAFLGELFISLFQAICNPMLLAWDSIVDNVQNAGLKALPIIGLMSFLIGLVLAYQLSAQLQTYGADIFVVDITAIGVLRGFGPLITAIVMAGRTSTSFAALIGTMKVNEELDALSTMGITPMSRLVLPRIIAILIIMPLLIVWADILGIFGSMFMSKALMGIGYISFLDRMHYEVSATEYLLGIVKAPVFSLIIAGVGCLQGTLVGSSADSVGQKTTQAAVQAIFMVIISDAGFSILFSWLGI